MYMRERSLVRRWAYTGRADKEQQHMRTHLLASLRYAHVCLYGKQGRQAHQFTGWNVHSKRLWCWSARTSDSEFPQVAMWMLVTIRPSPPDFCTRHFSLFKTSPLPLHQGQCLCGYGDTGCVSKPSELPA